MVGNLSGPVRQPKSGKINELVIFFHGYGADGNDLISLSDHFTSVLPSAEFYAPNAPDLCEMGGVGYQWFPIRQNNNGTLDLNAKEEISRSVRLIDSWLNDLISKKNIHSSKVLLVGFSQGTMIALETLISRSERFLGLIGFSGGFLGSTSETAQGSIQTPILLVHGDSDPVVPVEMTNSSAKALGQKGFIVEKHISRGVGHGISPDGLSRATDFVKNLMLEITDH